MIHIQCPDSWAGKTRREERLFFIAGGISGTSDWQSELIKRLQVLDDLVVLNPRRKEYDWDDPSLMKAQIEWEHEHLQMADAHAFWFSPETVCPIALFELGRIIGLNRPLCVGCDPAYRRRQDIQIQLGLLRPLIAVGDSLNHLANDIAEWLRLPPGRLGL